MRDKAITLAIILAPIILLAGIVWGITVAVRNQPPPPPVVIPPLSELISDNPYLHPYESLNCPAFGYLHVEYGWKPGVIPDFCDDWTFDWGAGQWQNEHR